MRCTAIIFSRTRFACSHSRKEEISNEEFTKSLSVCDFL
jgi:hypothetical protein